jgi:hypothetical protein
MISSSSATARARGQLVADFLAGAWRAKQTPPDISSSDLEQVAALLYDSGGTGLAWWRIHESDLSNSACGELLHQGYRLQALQTPINEDRVLTAYRLLRGEGIEPILIKGWAAARFYPHRTLRSYGDVDLLVGRTQFAGARELLDRDKGATWWVDLHSGLQELDDRSTDELFERSQVVILKDQEIRVLSDEDHLALLSLHLFKHGAWRPAWLCDIGALSEAGTSNFDWQTCLGSNKHHSSWIAAGIALAQQLLGANLDQAPVSIKQKQLPEWLVDAVLQQWGNLFQAEHLPVRPQRLMSHSLKSPGTIFKDIRARWPDPIVATFNLRGAPNNFPRLPYQLRAFTAQAGRYLIEHARRRAARAV